MEGVWEGFREEMLLSLHLKRRTGLFRGARMGKASQSQVM